MCKGKKPMMGVTDIPKMWVCYVRFLEMGERMAVFFRN